MRRRPRRHRRTARLAPALAERRILLASAVGSSPEESAELARRALDVTADGLVATFGRLARERPDADGAQGRLLLLLVDVEHRPLERASGLVGVTVEDARPLLTEARRQMGTERLGATCRGWGLVCRGPQLTPAEQSAMAAHVQLCRRCRDRLAEVDRARKALLARTAGVAAALATAELVALGAGGSAAVGGAGVLAGKAVVGLVGALGAAVVAGGGVAAVAQSSSTDPAAPSRPAAVVEGRDPGAAPSPSLPVTPPTAPTPSTSGAPALQAEVVAPTTPAPSSSAPAPSIPLPTSLPVPLPSALDVAGLPLPVPTLPQVLPTTLTPLVPVPTPQSTASGLPLLN